MHAKRLSLKEEDSKHHSSSSFKLTLHFWNILRSNGKKKFFKQEK